MHTSEPTMYFAIFTACQHSFYAERCTSYSKYVRLSHAGTV